MSAVCVDLKALDTIVGIFFAKNDVKEMLRHLNGKQPSYRNEKFTVKVVSIDKEYLRCTFTVDSECLVQMEVDNSEDVGENKESEQAGEHQEVGLSMMKKVHRLVSQIGADKVVGVLLPNNRQLRLTLTNENVIVMELWFKFGNPDTRRN